MWSYYSTRYSDIFEGKDKNTKNLVENKESNILKMIVLI